MRPYLLIGVLLGAGCVALDGDVRPVGDWKRTNADVHVGLARAALDRQDWETTAQNAREALRVDAERIDAAVLLSQALLRMGELAAAENAAQRALGLDEEASQPWLLLGECRLAADRAGEARAAYAEAAARGSAAAGLVLGALRFADGDHEGAERAFRSADEQDGGVDGRALLAAQLRAFGRTDDAERILQEVAVSRPDDRGLRLSLDEVRFERADLASIIDRVRAAAHAGRPAPLEDRLLAAAGCLRRGDGVEASRAYRRLARTLPDEPGIRLALGEALLLERDSAGAEAAFLAATRLDEDSRVAWVGVARARRQAGRPAAAIEPLDRAVEIDPSHGPTRSLLVSALVDVGDVVRATSEAEEVRIIEPGGRLDQACRRLLARQGGAEAEGDRESHR